MNLKMMLKNVSERDSESEVKRKSCELSIRNTTH